MHTTANTRTLSHRLTHDKSRLAFLVMSVLALLLLAAWPISPASAQINDAQITVSAPDYSDIYNQVAPSVVSISVVKGQGAGGGTGFVLDTAGHIATNHHVVAGAQRIEVQFFDGTLARASIIGLDPDSDLAVIQVENVPAERLFPVTFGDSGALEVGEPVLAIGSPFGERWTLTSGIVSALERTIRSMGEFSIGGVIQTDAAINPGNSGGPLLNIYGEVIGVNSQIVSASGSSAGIGFAVPGNLTQRNTQMLISQGQVAYSFLGINGSNVSLELIEALGLPNNTQGVVVSGITPGGPAARAGLQPLEVRQAANSGIVTPTQVDIITAVDGRPLSGMDALISYLAQQTQPGDTVMLTVLRNGEQTLTLSATLTPRP